MTHILSIKISTKVHLSYWFSCFKNEKMIIPACQEKQNVKLKKLWQSTYSKSCMQLVKTSFWAANHPTLNRIECGFFHFNEIRRNCFRFKEKEIYQKRIPSLNQRKGWKSKKHQVYSSLQKWKMTTEVQGRFFNDPVWTLGFENQFKFRETQLMATKSKNVKILLKKRPKCRHFYSKTKQMLRELVTEAYPLEIPKYQLNAKVRIIFSIFD